MRIALLVAVLLSLTACRTTTASGDASVSTAAEPAPAALLVRPVALPGNVPPAYNQAARDAGLEGLMLVQCTVTATGDVTGCHIIKPLARPMMDPVVLAALESWKFQPASRGGQPVAVSQVFPIKLVNPRPKAEAPSAGDPTGVRESLGQSDVQTVALSHRAELESCVEEQHRREPGRTGKLVMGWQIETGGETSSVAVLSRDLETSFVGSCVAALIEGWVFPPHRIRGARIVWPLQF